MTGLWCPLCGSTRAGHALLHADPATALPTTRCSCWRCRCWPGSGGGGAVTGPAAPAAAPSGVWAGVAVVLAFGVLRNLPPGRWLAPPG